MRNTFTVGTPATAYVVEDMDAIKEADTCLWDAHLSVKYDQLFQTSTDLLGLFVTARTIPICLSRRLTQRIVRKYNRAGRAPCTRRRLAKYYTRIIAEIIFKRLKY